MAEPHDRSPVGDEGPPRSPEGAAAAVAPAPAPPAEPPPSRARRGARLALQWAAPIALAGAIVLAGVVPLAPWLASETALLSAVAQAALGPGAAVGEARASWSEGLVLREVLAPTEDGGQIMLAEVRLEAPLSELLAAALGDAQVEGRLVVGPGRARLVVPAEEAADAPADAGDEDGARSPLADARARLTLELRPLQVEVRIPAAEAGAEADAGAATRVVLDDLQGGGRLVLADGDLRLEDAAFEAARATTATPSGGVLALRQPDLTVNPLVLPLDARPADVLRGVVADGALAADLASGGAAIGALQVDLAAAGGEARVSVTTRGAAAAPGAASPGADRPGLTLTLTVDGRRAERWPATLAVAAQALPVRGAVGDVLPYLLPLLDATAAEAGVFPPVALRLGLDGAVVWDAAGGLDLEATVAALSGAGRLALAPGRIDNSVVLEGYARALLDLDLSGVLDGLLPGDLTFGGGQGTFVLEGSRVRVPSWTLEAGGVRLGLRGEVDLTGGAFVVRLDATAPTLPTELRGILRAVEEAGGIVLEGDLGLGEVRVKLPSPDQLARTAQRLGALDAFRERAAPLFDAMREALKGGRGEGAPLGR